jgi:hypothetical protein
MGRHARRSDYEVAGPSRTDLWRGRSCGDDGCVNWDFARRSVRAVSLDYSRSGAARVGVRRRVALEAAGSTVGCADRVPHSASRSPSLDSLHHLLVKASFGTGVKRSAGCTDDLWMSNAVLLVVRNAVAPHRVQNSGELAG